MQSLLVQAMARKPIVRTGANRAAPGAGAALALALLVLSSSAASAYPLDTGGFTDGTDTANVLFNPGITEITGPSIRLLTNATITQSSLVVAGVPGFVNSTTQETTSGDFATYTSKDALQISNGQMFLDNDLSVVTLDGSNTFLSATFNGTKISLGKVVLNGTTSGSFVSDNITAPLAGWGSLMAAANLSAGGSLTVDLMSPSLSLLASNLSLSAPIALDPIGNPTVRVRATLSAPSVATTPLLDRITLGHRTGDTLIGSGVARNDSNIVAASGTDTIVTSTISFARHPTSPYIANVASTYYSKFIYSPNVIKVNDTWHLFAAVNNVGSTAGASIGHATSSDFVSWTWDASTVLNASASGWDSHHVDMPWVIADPNGTGYRMYYAGWSSATRMQSGLATSSDLVNWTKYASNPVLAYSSSGWDSYNSGAPSVLYENGTWKMWYAGTSVTSGGGNSVGYATSTDGYNWTKYASNPVLSRGGAGTIDRDDFQKSTVRQWNGVYYLYAGCNTNGAYHICAATSTDGIGWTKHSDYVLNASGSGWEGGWVAFCDLVVNNGRFILLYQGAVSGATTWQIGRVDANFINGVARGRLDFGARLPTSLTSATFDATAPSGTTVELHLRSSSDASTWTAFENLTSTSTISTTPVRRYVEWYVYLNATVRSDPPVFRGLTIDYRAYRSTGRYVSSPIAYPEQISAAAVAITKASPNGTVTIDVSNDNGSSFLRVTNGTFTNLTLVGNSLIYALNFECTNQQSPIIDTVDIIVQRRGLPENVTVRLGNNGTRFFNATGVFDVGVNVSLPVGAMNGIIAATLAQFPGATYVDVPLVVTSSHYGAVSLSAPRVTQVLKNPLTATFDPPGTALSMDENETTPFSVAASTYPPSVKINITWSQNGAPLPALQDKTNYNFTADFFSAGDYTIRCDVENGDFAYNHTWALTVLNVNRPPTFITLSPATPLNVSHTATTVFTAIAQDLDLENLTYAWRLNGTLIAANGTSATLSNLSVGSYTLLARAFDPYSSISFIWRIVSTNAVPTLLAADPPGNFSISHVAQRTLTATVTDGDSDPIVYRWVFDGVLAQNGSASFTVSNLPKGTHVVSVSFSDPYSTVVFSWTITSTNDAPVISAADPAGNFSLSHTATRTVSVTVTDADGEPLVFAWTLDGAPLGATGPAATLSSLPFGLHTLRLLVSDAYTSAIIVWTVTSTNDAPAVTTLQAPPSDQSRSHNEFVRLDIAVADGDGDTLLIEWTVNGLKVQTNVTTLFLDPVGLGPILVRASVSDGIVATVWSWNTTGTNAAPLVLSSGPGSNLTVSTIDLTVLSVQASDPDSDPLTFRWYVDDALAGANASLLTVGPLAGGAHLVRVTISDGLLDATAVFSIEAVNLQPAFLAFDPQTNFTLSHLASSTVRVVVIDHEDDSLSYRWTLDNLSLASTANSTGLGPLAAGSHLLVLEVSDGLSTVRREWRVTSSDLPPQVDGVSPPAGSLSVATFVATTFTARTLDPDGDPVLMAWFDGNSPVVGTTEVSLRWMTSGSRVVTLEVTSTGFRQTITWNVTVTSSNVAPRLLVFVPNASLVSLDLEDTLAFAVSVDDDGVLPLTVEWRLDGALVANGTAFVFHPTADQVGDHNLTVVVSDTEYTLDHSWSLKVSTRPTAQEASGGGAAMMSVGALAAAALVAALFLRRRSQSE